MKRILVFYGSYGGGHIAAAKSISNHIAKNYSDVEIQSVDCIEYINKYINKISTEAYKEATKRTPHMWKFVYKKSNNGAIAKLATASNKIMAMKLSSLINEFKPDLIISTHPFSSQMCAYLKSRRKVDCYLATIMTDFHIHNQWLYLPEYVDYFFVSNENMKLEMINKNISEEKIFVTGIPVSDSFKEKFDKSKICREFYLDQRKYTILFFAGGEFGLAQKTAFTALKCIIKLLKEVQVIAISGKNKKIYDDFCEIVKKTNSNDRVKVLEYTNKVPELMSIADVVVTKSGGLTIAESLCSKLPIIIINPIPGQEEENAEFLESKNCAIWIRKDEDIVKTIKYLAKNPKKLVDMSNASAEISKPDATKNICDILMDKIN